jgi:hypothetical protein
MPNVADTDDEYAWQVEVRTHVVGELCEHGWDESLKQCVVDEQRSPHGLAGCLSAAFSEPEHDAFTQRMTEITALAKKIAAAKKKPATFSCAKVVALHYADANWKLRLEGFKPAERKRMISESRALMTKACAAWSDTTRACVIAGGELGDCFDEDNRPRWGYPAIGSVSSVGIPECDDYSAVVTKFTSCNLLGDAARKTIVRSQQQLLAEIARLPASDRAKMGTSCKAGMEAVSESLADLGC